MPYKDKVKQREYQRQWVAGRRREFMRGKSCNHCGSIESLEIDHVDSDSKKNASAHNVWSLSSSRRERELAKCQVLCRICHVEKGKASKDWRRKPGRPPVKQRKDRTPKPKTEGRNFQWRGVLRPW